VHKKIIPFHPIKDGELYWYQPKQFIHIYELRHLQECFATFLWNRQRVIPIQEPSASAVSATGGWSFRHTDNLLPMVTVRNLGAYLPYATFDFWSHDRGMLWISDELSFTWERQDQIYSWLDPTKKDKLIQFKENDQFTKGAQVEISPQAWGCTELVLLALLGWYLVLIMKEPDFLMNISGTSQ
jgi:hypothetical protein